MPKSWKVGVKTKGDRDWVFNALRFTEHEDARAYASDLMLRWTAVYEVTVVASDDTLNATFPMPSDRYKTQREL